MARHIRNYARVLAQIRRHYRKERKEAEARLEGLVSESWRTDPQPLGLVRWKDMSDEAWENCLQEEKAKRVADVTELLKKSLPKWERKELERLERADKAGELWEISIRMDWRKSRTWGNCPRVEARVGTRDKDGNWDNDGLRKGYASGCGYDKSSAAICEAIGSAPALDRYCIEHPSLWHLYAVEGKTCLPHFSFGGKGVSTFEAIFRGECRKENGYELSPYKGCPRWKITHMEGKTFDGWEITRER
jgi:hypothetical protein